MARIVDAQEPPPAARRGRWLALAAVVLILLVFAATLEPVQRTARTALGLAGLLPLAVTMSGMVIDEGGLPIAHAFVRVDQGQELAATYTDETGGYRMGFTIRTAAPAHVSFGANGYEASLR
ncbi:MAG: carboxypeptidase regulatory-like domain-containing protein, partial [Chloroflexi bacterium]